MNNETILLKVLKDQNIHSHSYIIFLSNRAFLKKSHIEKYPYPNTTNTVIIHINKQYFYKMLALRDFRLHAAKSCVTLFVLYVVMRVI